MPWRFLKFYFYDFADMTEQLCIQYTTELPLTVETREFLDDRPAKNDSMNGSKFPGRFQEIQ